MVAVVVLVLFGGAAIGGVYNYVNGLVYDRVEGEYFDSDGVKIHYTIEGQGPPVILIHGFSVNADLQWRRSNTHNMLKQDYTVVAIDNRGHGLSDKPHDPEAYGDQFAKDVINLMDHLGFEKAAVVGYSMGGMITYGLVQDYPDRLVCAAPCGFGFAPETPESTAMLDSLAGSLESGEGFMPLFLGLQPEGQPANESEFKYMNDVLMNLNDEQALAALVRSWKTLQPDEEKLANNEVPILSIVGGIDPLRAGVDHMSAYTGNMTVHVVEGRDHMNALTPEFDRVLKEFIDRQYDALEDEPAQPQAA